MLLHLLPEDRADDPIAPAAGEPFVHLCHPAQLDEVRRRHFAGRALCVCEIDPAALDATKLRDEDLYGHGAFPHYYGAVPDLAVRARRAVAAVTPSDVERAEGIVRRAFPPTPLLFAARLSARLGVELWLKLDTTTPIRAFKIRGALVKLDALGEVAGVITASAGNHGLAVAWAARAHGKPATVVVPTAANPQKMEAIRAVGAQVIAHGTDYQAALEHSVELGAARGLASVHAYDDPWIIAGQGTLARELPPADTVVASIGGGGLIAGLSVAWKAQVPRGNLVGVQPVGADSMVRSFEAGELRSVERVDTLADGLGARRPSALTFRLARAGVDRLARVSDAAMVSAMRTLLEDERLVSEPAGAAALAAIIADPSLAVGKTVVVMSGANISDALLDEIRRPSAR